MKIALTLQFLYVQVTTFDAQSLLFGPRFVLMCVLQFAKSRDMTSLQSGSIHDTSISTLGNFMHVMFFRLPGILFLTGEGLELVKTLKEWSCVVFHSKALWTVSWLCCFFFNTESKESKPYCLF